MASRSSSSYDVEYDDYDYDYEEPKRGRGSHAIGSGKRPGAWLPRILTMLGLVACLIASGFFACLIPQATTLLARATAENELSPFTKDQLVQVAEATRDYSFGNHDARELYRVIYRINMHYQAEHAATQQATGTQSATPQVSGTQQQATGTQSTQPQASGAQGTQPQTSSTQSVVPQATQNNAAGTSAGAQASGQASGQLGNQQLGTSNQPITGSTSQIAPSQPDVSGLSEESTAAEFEAAFAGASTTYVYDRETMSHLDDCYRISRTALIVLAIVAGLAFIGLIVIGIRAGKRAVGWTFKAAGILVLVAFVALGVWVFLDFNGFFTFFHSLFFRQGSWVFAYDSLLICALPTGFWVGMGAIWIATSVLASILFIVIGSALRKKRI